MGSESNKARLVVALLALLVSSAFVNVSCGSSQSEIIGDPVSKTSSFQIASANEQKQFYFFDSATSRLVQVSIDPFAITRFQSYYSLNSQNTFIGAGKGFVYILSPKGIAVVSDLGLVQTDFFSFQGTPVSSAYREGGEFLVVYDDLQSVGIAAISDAGEVTNAWVGGPLFEDDRKIVSGDLVGESSLVLGFSDKSLGIVDLNQSIAEKKWVYEAYSGLDESIEWIAPVDGNNNIAFVSSEKGMATFDIDRLHFLQEVALEEEQEIKIRGKNNKSHIITEDGEAGQRIYYSDAQGNITSQEFEDFASNAVSTALDDELFTLFSIDSGVLQGYQIQLSDLLVTGEFRRPFPSNSLLSYDENAAVIVYPSDLGKVEKIDFSGQRQGNIEGYNIPFFQN